MRHRRGLVPPFLLVLCLLLSRGEWQVVSHAASPQAIQAPQLKWQKCSPSWCQTGWYSSPAVADLDGDGDMEVVNASYYITVREGATGNQIWQVASGHDLDEPGATYVGRTWPGVVVADVDGDEELEIVTAHEGGYVSVYNRHGYFEPGWPQRPTTGELRGLSVYDLDGDGTLEIAVTAAIYRSYDQWFVYEHDGTPGTGWPQLALGAPGYTSGLYNDNNAIADLDGDGRGEIVGPSDVHYIAAYNDDGSQIQANAMYGSKVWSQVGVHVDHAVDLRGYANCDNPPHPPLEPRPNFANSPATVADLNGDGVLEIVVVGNNHDCRTRPYTDLYEMVYIFSADRSRWSGDGFDWTAIPAPDSSAAPLSEDWNVIESNQPNPVVVDLDGDGYQEILYSSYDGRVHAYWLDKIEHGNWPYEVYTGGIYRFASEPAVADLDNDGHAEVIFASWTQKYSNQVGKLHILDYLGNSIHAVDLPANLGSYGWNGALAAPTLANIDDDADLEVVLNTANSGAVAYDLPGTANARILWGTGRGNYQRTGSILHGSIRSSWARVAPTRPGPGDTLAYTVLLENPGPLLPSAHVTSTLSADVYYLGDLWASSGSYGAAGGVITWTGAVSAGVPVTITYGVTVSLQVSAPHAIPNLILIDDGLGNVEEQLVVAIANGHACYLPLVLRQY